MGILVEDNKGKEFQKYDCRVLLKKEHICKVLPTVKDICSSAVKDLKNTTLDNSDEAGSSWKAAYYSLIMLEKILKEFGDLFFQEVLEVCKVI